MARSFPYTKKVILRIFRMAVRLALTTHEWTYQELKELLSAAVYQELRARGCSHGDIQVVMACSRTQVKHLRDRVSEVENIQPSPHLTERVLERIAEKASTRFELEKFIGGGEESGKLVGIALRLLCRRGVIEEVRRRGKPTLYQLRSVEAASKTSPKCDDQLTDVYAASIIIIREVTIAGCLKHSFLFNPVNCERIPQKTRKEALEFLLSEGILKAEDDCDIGGVVYTIARTHQVMVPSDPIARVKVGLDDFLENCTTFVCQLCADPEQLPLAQRSLWFKARPGALESFYRKHRDDVVRQVEEIEEEAKDHSDAQDVMMLWASLPRR